ncbi:MULTISPECIES: PAS domain-containing sensor histidine kinase [Anaeromyxobacter]|uniref:PAS domain-containing sensor histidine kinase n=1 Tax=Anaeromyxobacter TaxID=161492 RepID=UPI001F587A83|nr:MULTISPECIES: PAS domain-containing sensor histidine kinase [unclassified Anaeromyxobacter]
MDFSLLDSVPDAMVIADEGGEIVHVNAEAERLFGWPRAELSGQPIEVLLPGRFRAMHRAHRGGYHAAPRRRPMGLGLDLSGLRRDGAEFAAEISLSPIEVDGRRCVVAAVRDVSERKLLEERARQWSRAQEKAQEEVRERDEFLSVASHELRTPVTALQLQLQLLHRLTARAGTDIPRMLEPRVEALERQTRRIAILVNEILDVSRMRLGRLQLRYEPLDLADVAREVAEHLREEVARSGSTLRLELGAVVGRWDRTRLEQVVTHLLVNAAKFGEGKPITLTVEASGAHARMRVSDQGMGIAPEHHARVFERFERAVPIANFGGLGLGLYVARQIVEAHGGEIRVESVPGSGATFVVDLPREPPSARAPVTVDGAALH